MMNSLISEVTWVRLMAESRDPLCEIGYGAEHADLPNVYGQVSFDLDREMWRAEVWAVAVVDGDIVALDPTVHVLCAERDEARITVEAAMADVAAGNISLTV